MSVLATIGCFDGVHLGHRYLLEQVVRHAASRGLDPVAITFDQHPAAVLGRQIPPMLTPLDTKLRLLATCGLSRVIVLPFDQQMAALTAREFLDHLRQKYDVRALVIGYDHHFGRRQAGEGFAEYSQYGRECGVELILATELPDISVSSSAVRRALLCGDIQTAAALLGRPFVLQGKVGKGQQLGRTIGFPTANIEPESQMIIPARGVYATTARLADGTSHPAVTNIGCRPTVAASDALSVETYIINYGGNLYGESLEITFRSRIRDERRFDSLEKLRAQIAADVAAAQKLPLE